MVLLFGIKQVYSKKEWLKLTLALLIGLGIPLSYFNHIYKASSQYAHKYLHASVGGKGHIFWATTYLGFGFLKHGNPDNITWDDNFGIKKVQEISPGQPIENVQHYEAILKNEVINHFLY